MDARDEAGEHLPGPHDRKTHGRRYGPPAFEQGVGFSGRSGGAGGGSSKTDRLIEELMDESPRRGATPEEIAEIVGHLSEASFDRRKLRVKKRLRGLSYGGYTLGEREDSLVAHFVQRVAIDKQWAEGTTEEQYVEDLRAGARHPSARIAAYRQAGGNPLVVVFSDNVVPEDRRGPNAEPHQLLVYSPELGFIITGYQVSGLGAIREIPPNTWLD